MKLVLKLINVVGTCVMIFGLFGTAWLLERKTGSLSQNTTYSLFQSFDKSSIPSIFTSFDDTFANYAKYTTFAMIGLGIVVSILEFVEYLVPNNKNKNVVNGFQLVFSALIVICVILIFVFDIIFIKNNNYTNSYLNITFKPIMQNGTYLILLGGFASGIFGILEARTK